jgi:DNA repair exonuclease SbcCD ATPase subunit
VSNTNPVTEKLEVEVKNIGGIDEAEVTLSPGITLLIGRNATNRTSFLRAVMTALGSDEVSLKSDADEGEATIRFGEKTYTRRLTRQSGSIITSGNPYLDDSDVADLFAFLLESNEARRSVVQSADLRDIIMRPIDTGEIRAEIERLERERDRINEELENLEEVKSELPALDERRADLKMEMEEKRAELTDKESEIESIDAEVSETRAEKQELENRLQELRDFRSELESVRSEIELQKESIESLRSERSELQDELEELPETPMGDHQELDVEISRLRDRRQTLETEMSNLQDIIQFNEKMLDGQIGAASDAPGVADNVINDPTDQLLADDTVSCWTCGSEVSRERIEETVDELQSVRQNYLEDVREIENELDELQETQRERESQQRRREKLERNIAETEDELEQRQETLEDIREQREDLGVKIETVETEVEELESEDFSEVLDLHKEANQLEFELERLESNLEDITDRIANIEDHLTEEDGLREQREQIRDDLEDQRTRIDRIEQEAVEQFNEHMDEVLDLLEYDRLSRIWIERIIETVREGRGKTEQTAFELHVVRTTETNIAYEDTLDHLSESEREVTSLVFALAGYLVHDVHEQIPIMLLDSIEAIDSERIAALVDYISEFVEYLIIALLPEDAQAVSSADTRIIDI